MFFGCTACGILAPRPAWMEPASPALEAWGASREVPDFRKATEKTGAWITGFVGNVTYSHLKTKQAVILFQLQTPNKIIFYFQNGNGKTELCQLIHISIIFDIIL